MQLIAYGKGCRWRPLLTRKTFLAMKMLTLILFIACLGAGAKGLAQNITISLKNAPLEKVFKEVERQSHYRFVYTKEQLDATYPVTINVANDPLETVLQLCFRGQPLSFSIDKKYILVKSAAVAANPPKAFTDVNGKVINEYGEPVSGFIVRIKNSDKTAITNALGEFTFNGIEPLAILLIRGVEIEAQDIAVNNRNFISIRIQHKIGDLDQVIMTAYGQTTRRLNTGNITKISAEEISSQPVSNPLAVLQGRVPGMIVTQSSGVPGAAFTVEIRGRSSLDFTRSQNDPLFVIDGVPFEPGNLPSNQLASAVNNPRQTSQGGMSPLNTINPSDIESIEILKDADATSIYGSRGANGVVLITTKKGVAGRTKVTVQLNTGWSKALRTTDMLNTSQYVSMRKEAFSNDGIVPVTTAGAGFAPDILLWDTTRYTNFRKMLTGNTAHSSDIQTSLSGGDINTQFLMGVGFHRETNVFSDDLDYTKWSAHLKINHSFNNKKGNAVITASYSGDRNRLISTDLSTYANLPPNLLLYDSLGNLKWNDKGVAYGTLSIANPLSVFLRKYTARNEALISNLILSYRLTPSLIFKTSVGYSTFITDEAAITPKAAIDPLQATILASARFANRNSHNWILEPQLSYTKKYQRLAVDILLGSSFQQALSKGNSTFGTNYTNDLLLYSIAAAGTITATNDFSEYKYNAVFGKLSLNWAGQYLLNISTRRDGSSRFGNEKKFAGFYSIGVGWIFTNDSILHRLLPFLSFGKIRSSYGTSGNDQIGDYKYLDLWSNAGNAYQGAPGLLPNILYNPDYNWERNKKFEVAFELGFLKDRLNFSASYYNQHSGNQLIGYSLPAQTGFSTVTLNWPALVVNSGIEFLLSTKNILRRNFSWTSSMNLTIPRNKLKSFPGLSTSSYYSMYIIGEPLSLIKRYRFLGVNPQTGIYELEDVNGDGQITSAFDEKVTGKLYPSFYGGIQNSLTLKDFRLVFFADIRRQTGLSYLSTQSSYRPGTLNNQPVIVLERWQKAGDITSVQKYTTSTNSPAGVASGPLFTNSNAIYADASFIRLRNISISYNLPARWSKKMKSESGNIYLHAQNLWTITNYKGGDPETQNYQRLPPLKTIVLGFQLNF